MACIIYYENLDYDQLPTSRKKARLEPGSCNDQQRFDAPHFSPPTPVFRTTKQATTTSPTSPYFAKSKQNPSNSNSYSNSFAPTVKYPLKPSQQQQQQHQQHQQQQQQQQQSQTSSFTPASYHSDNNSDGFLESIHSEASNGYCDHHPPETRLLFETLRKYFKFTSFRENQQAAIEASCRGLDTLILMPTGGGKSICYQLPAIITDGVTIVVSPLKSLIEDQVMRLQSLNIRSSALSGETAECDAAEVYHDLRSADPKHKLLYVTPEKITRSQALINLFKSLHSRNKLARFVIDEAHCVSMWGSDFRPDFRKLSKLRDLFKDVPIMALTATAPPKVRDDIYKQLKMSRNNGRTFIQSFNRPNLKFEVRQKSAKTCIVEICQLIRKEFKGQCGIIYCLSRNDCAQVSQNLRDQGITSAPYHAGLSDVHRKKVFQAWSDGTFQVVCATIAFGMGIDKSDVRFVIHYSVPKSLEGYYQEAGRAGRDGNFASCILYFAKTDLFRMKSMMSRGFGRKAEDKQRDQGNLEHMIKYVENRSECRRAILLRYLGEEFNRNDCISHIKTACDNCLMMR